MKKINQDTMYFPSVHWANILIFLVLFNIPLLGCWKLLLQFNIQFIWIVPANILWIIPLSLRFNKMGLYIRNNDNVTVVYFIRTKYFKLSEITNILSTVRPTEKRHIWIQDYRFQFNDKKTIIIEDKEAADWISKTVNIEIKMSL